MIVFQSVRGFYAIGLHEAKDQGKNEYLHPGIEWCDGSCIKVMTDHYSAKQLGWIPIVAGQSFQISFHVTIEN